MRFMEVYEGILNYEIGLYPTIPSFISFYISFIFKGCRHLRGALYTAFW
jgi:hypothetical protein